MIFRVSQFGKLDRGEKYQTQCLQTQARHKAGELIQANTPQKYHQ